MLTACSLPIMDPFERLPAELVRQILQDTADFLGMESLILVSLRARWSSKLTLVRLCVT
jgi:hypothetical protein